MAFSDVDFFPRVGDIVGIDRIKNEKLKSSNDICGVFDVAALLETLEGNALSVICPIETARRSRTRSQQIRWECYNDGFYGHRLSKWAQDDPKNFFQAAEKYEAVGNRRYREIEFALPNELETVKQYRQIVGVFIAKHLSDHYYVYAIHNKIDRL